jgi:hypothetical protein
MQTPSELTGIFIMVLLHGFLMAWPLWLPIVAVALGKLAFQMIEKQKLAKSGI